MEMISSTTNSRTTVLVTTNEFAGKRIDVVVSMAFSISRTQAQRLITSGRVLLNDQPILDCSKKLSGEGYVSIVEDASETPSYQSLPLAQNIEINIIYEDDEIIVLDKEAGMVCHPAPGNRDGTLVNALVHHSRSLSTINDDVSRPGIVHRLDKDTSGIMIVAKTNRSHTVLAGYFANKDSNLIVRKYKCFAFGTPHGTRGIIDTFIMRDPKNRQKYTTSVDTGKRAITVYNTIKTKYITSTKAISFVECQLKTGRTHQIRVHMQHIDCPIIGDPVYKKKRIEDTYPETVRNFARPALHSYFIEFLHPVSKKSMSFESELPADMQELANLISNSTE
jgi:23S rRNA pseudouridine1911/1915/1917 synthase